MEAAVRAEVIAQGKQLKEQLSQLEAILDEAEVELQHEAQKLPNLTHPQVLASDKLKPPLSQVHQDDRGAVDTWCCRVQGAFPFTLSR